MIRQRIEELLSRQYSAKTRAEFVQIGLEIFHVTTGIGELEPSYRPDPTIRPPPVRKNVCTMEDLQEARRTLAQMEARGDRYSSDFHWLNRQVETAGPIIEERAGKGTL
jgi:hypothetical protein